MTVRDKRENRALVAAGSLIRTRTVMIPVAVVEELTVQRTTALERATASVRAEGQTAAPEVEMTMSSWARGELSTEQMRDRVRSLYHVP